MSAERLARALGGARRCGAGFIARCPAHDDRSPSLSIREGEGGRVLLKCFAGCQYSQLVAALVGAPVRQTFGLRAQALGAPADEQKRIQAACRIWRESRPAPGTLVETYLRSRGITIEPPASLHYHPALKHPSGVRLPAMLAAVEDRDGRLIGVHRTWLSPDGRKASVEPVKAALGPIAGGAVRLTPTGETLCIAEGIETALSVMQATGVPTWAALGTSNLVRVELPAIVREIIICADADRNGSGERAAQVAAQGFLRDGRRVRIARPPAGAKDFNDSRIS